jgi:3,4-dihydroxy-2-butanone 4-phosphate synthase
MCVLPVPLECADPFLGLVAKQCNRFGRPNVLRFAFEQVAHVGTGLRHAEQPRLMVDHFLKLGRAHLLGARQVGDQPRIQIARAAAHHQSRRRGETHAGIDALAVAHRGQARAVAEMGKDHAALRRRRVGEV